MNAREQEQAAEAARRRHEDICAAVIEAIGEVKFRRTRQVANAADQLCWHHIGRGDFSEIAMMVATNLEVEFQLPAFDEAGPISTVDQFVAAIEAQLPKDPAP